MVDLYTAAVAAATGRDSIPQADWDRVRVYLPRSQKGRVIRSRAFHRTDAVRPARIYPEELRERRRELVLLFRGSMAREIEKAGCLEGARAVWSMWPGYLGKESGQQLLSWLDRLEIPLHRHHASGHAYLPDLVRMVDALAPGRVVPIHSLESGRFSEFFPRVERRADGEWWEVQGGMAMHLVFDSYVTGCPASIINIGKKSATCTTAAEGKQVTTVEDAQERLRAAPLCMTYTVLERYRENFELFHRIVGDRSPGKLELENSEMRNLLQRFEAHRDQVLELRETLETLSIDTELRRSYLDHSGDTFALGSSLLHQFEEAQRVYERCPKMRTFGASKRGGSASGRGEKLRHQLQQSPGSLTCAQGKLTFVDYEIKPLNINHFRWRDEFSEITGETDIRLSSVDLLMRLESAAMICE